MTQATNDWGSPNTPPNHWSIKTNPINKENKSVYLTTVWMLGITILLTSTGIFILAFLSRDIPQALIAISSGCVGALASLLGHK